MSEKTKPFWVGVFFVIGSSIAIIVLIWLGSSNWFKETKTYSTYFDYTVQGLNIDAPVKFRGVQVGRVSQIGVAPDGQLIEVIMKLDPVLDISDSLRAGLELTGITGLRYIELDITGPEKRELHPKLTFKPAYEVIPSAPGGFEEIEQALRDIYDKLMAIDTEGISYRAKLLLDEGIDMVSSADSLFSDRNFTEWSRRLNRSIIDADSMIKELDFAYYDERLETALVEISEGAAHFNQFLAELEYQAQSLRIDDRMSQTFAKIDQLITASTEIISRLNYQSSQVMTNISATLLALNETIAELNSLVISMEAYPSNVFYAAPPPKEK